MIPRKVRCPSVRFVTGRSVWLGTVGIRLPRGRFTATAVGSRKAMGGRTPKTARGTINWVLHSNISEAGYLTNAIWCASV